MKLWDNNRFHLISFVFAEEDIAGNEKRKEKNGKLTVIIINVNKILTEEKQHGICNR